HPGHGGGEQVAQRRPARLGGDRVPAEQGDGDDEEEPGRHEQVHGGEVGAGRGGRVHQGHPAVPALRLAADGEGDDQDERQGGEDRAQDQRAAALDLPDEFHAQRQGVAGAVAVGDGGGGPGGRVPPVALVPLGERAHAEPPIRVRKASSRRRCGPTDSTGTSSRTRSATRRAAVPSASSRTSSPSSARTAEATPGSAATFSASGSSTGAPVPTSRVSPVPTISCTGPAWTSRPRSMTTRWVQDCSTSARRWLETITVRP